jgi:hypothetical protein
MAHNIEMSSLDVLQPASVPGFGKIQTGLAFWHPSGYDIGRTGFYFCIYLLSKRKHVMNEFDVFTPVFTSGP